ncbi:MULTISPECIES: cupredoxin domain-containing protein [unclassified Rhodanobacter]|jgi:heme/copper-type cytochrome/quinol oxidase subunit 2|uniref:Cupredoxin domain-containing protein n=1 Tax=Rhodanobacter humi TaxID=1888173 RepID=A0ABV4AXI3_9GAMM|nr:MAG: cupredoxin domain-containing protein [Rhodanobacter sp.]
MKLFLPAILLCAALPCVAEGAVPEYTLVIHNHTYQPTTLNVPANTKFKLLVRNEDATPSEFESNDFNREQIVLPGTTATVFVGPLDRGSYTFFDDFHRATGNGVLVVQ